MAHTTSHTLGLVTKHQNHSYADNPTRKGMRERKTKRMTKTAVWFGGNFFSVWNVATPATIKLHWEEVCLCKDNASFCLQVSEQKQTLHTSRQMKEWHFLQKNKKKHTIYRLFLKVRLISTFTSCCHEQQVVRFICKILFLFSSTFGNAPNSQQLFCGCNPPFPLTFHMTSFA